ncbi:MAG: hypothetical protein WC437_05085 [Patescibacteria group bacterium]|jgi:chromosome segregation ATPase|nr:hypothetical protein [Patescibacteria group bacterium]
MKNKLTLTTLTLLVLPAMSFAVSDSANQGTSTQNQNTVTTQTQTQAQTNNTETGAQTQTQTRTEEQIQTQTEQDIESTKQQYQAKNNAVSSHASEIAKAVQSMLAVANRTNDPSIGEQIRTIAREQNQAVDSANKAMDKIQERSGAAKFFIGANYGQMKEVKTIMEQNQERIRELQQIMTKLTNEADKTEIQNQINVLELQNLNLANQLAEEAKGFTLFGWFIRWFYGV